MLEAATMHMEEEAISGMADMCNDLFREWSVELSLEEKKIWLWNASVEMHRIKQRKV